MAKDYILVIDEGTTGVRALIFDRDMHIKDISYQNIELFYPFPKAVECDPIEIYNKSVECCRDVVKKTGIDVNDIAGVAITNQRTTWVLWDKNTGLPVRNGVTWLDNRGGSQKEKLKDDPDLNKVFPGIIPFLPDMMVPFVIDRIRDDEPDFDAKLRDPNNLWGNIDAWLIWKLTGGKVFAETPSTATVSLLFAGTDFSDDLLHFTGLTKDRVPEIRGEAEGFGVMTADVLGVEIPICGVFADQQSALFSQGCVEPNSVKCTNGTGTFVDINIGNELKPIGAMNPIIAWKLDDEYTYMVEGFNNTSGTNLEWLKNKIKLFDNWDEMNQMAESVEDSKGICYVPALNGLLLPSLKDPNARGCYMGLTADTERTHMVRATLEGVGFSAVNIIKEAVEGGAHVDKIMLSGNLSKSNIIAQLISNVVDTKAIRPVSVEATALGAAEVAAINLGWFTKNDIAKFFEIDKVFEPNENKERDQALYEKWKEVAKRTTNL